MKCTKPNCDCIDQEIKKRGTELIKSYPCLAQDDDLEMEKSAMNNEPIKTAEDAANAYCDLKNNQTLGLLPADERLSLYFAHMAGQQYASQQTAELQREGERLIPLLTYFVGRLQTIDAEELNNFDKAMIERAEQALQDK